MTAIHSLILIFTMLVATACLGDDLQNEVAPILSSHCIRCHNDRQPQGELSLQSRAALMAGGESGEVIAAGDPDSSYLLELITPQNGKAAMPKGASPLSSEEVESIRRWIAAGATWPKTVRVEPARWWSLRPVSRPPLPALPAATRAWLNNPIDAFIAAKHLKHGLTPAAPTARRAWLRRISFDLTGLPPTPRELDRFIHDDAPDAWETAADRLLAAPTHGERWARHWLDVVRFSESNGFEDDAPRPHAWPYRDFVIRSLNADTPYDQFVRQQLAGDVLQPITRSGIEATGFLVAGPWDHAAAVAASQVEKLRAREVMMDEMLAAVSQTFMGLTVNCARCHDHKFDPIPQTDYYALKAVFEGIDQANGSDRGPGLVLTPEQRIRFDQRQAELQAEVDAQRLAWQQLEAHREALADKSNPVPLNRATAFWQFAAHSESDKQTARDLKGGQSNLSGKWTLRFDQPADTALRALNSDQRLVDTGTGTILRNQTGGAGYAIIPNLAGSELLPRPRTSLTQFARVRFTQGFDGVDDIFRIGSSPSEHRDTAGLEFVAPDATGDGKRQESARARFVTLGTTQSTEQALLHEQTVTSNRWYDVTGVFESLPATGSGRMTLYLFDPNTGLQLGAALTKDVNYDTLGSTDTQNLLFFVAPGFRNGAQPGAQMDLAAVWHEALPPSDIAALSAVDPTTVAGPDENDQQLREQLARLQERASAQKAKLKQCELRITDHRNSARQAFIGVRRSSPLPTVLYQRGDVRQPGPVIAPAALSAIAESVPQLSLGADASDADRRVAYAHWLTHDEHPLTARVIVNRLWHYHFGRGLVATPSDFGASGSLPSHPELLDWLAAELIDQNWNLKPIHRLIVTSATYRMQSMGALAQRPGRQAANDPTLLDADNRLLWHFPLRRLEAETVRDAMLAVSGNLNSQMYGPSVQPFEVTRFNTYFYNLVDHDEPAFNRRTIYRMNVNTGRDPLLDALDCPAPSVMTPSRRETTTPLQALALMNDTFALRQASELANRVKDEISKSPTIHREGNQPENVVPARIVLAWTLAVGREPDDEELAISADLVAESDFMTLCWTLLNSSEFLYLP